MWAQSLPCSNSPNAEEALWLNDDNLYTRRSESLLAFMLPGLGQLVAVTEHQPQQTLVEAGLLGVLFNADNGRSEKHGERQV